MKSVLSVIDAISEWSGKIISYVIPIVAALILYDVIMRYVFHSPSAWAGETYIYLCAILYLISGAYVLLHRAHVSMDMLYQRFSIRTRAIIDLVTFPIFFLVCGSLIWIGSKFFWSSWLMKETTISVWAPPIYPMKFVIPLGAFLMLLQGLAGFARNIHVAVRGKELS